MKINRTKNFKFVKIASILIAFFAVAVFCYYFFLNKQPNNSNQITNNPTAADNQQTSSQTDKKVSEQTPLAPVGVFVSNHHPNLSGSPAPNTESSTCTTTPNVKCQITFTMDGVTKTLPSKITDENGNTSWSWDIKEIGLTEGAWKVTAVAINGDKTATSEDALYLEITK